jgi:hypothetical protein
MALEEEYEVDAGCARDWWRRAVLGGCCAASSLSVVEVGMEVSLRLGGVV